MNPNITQIIDQYLSGELSQEDNAAFEAKMEQSETLRNEVSLQQSIMEGITRNHQRSTIKKVAQRYHGLKTMKWVGISVLAVAVIAISLYLIQSDSKNSTDEQEDNVEISDDVTQKLSAIHYFENVPVELFPIPESGKVALSRSGVLLSVPTDAFMKNGVPYSGDVIVHYQEARKGSDIVKSGLSTVSGDRLLQTQGMYSVQGFTLDGKPLEFNPKVGVYVQVPVEEHLKKMQLFDGITQKDGSIDWQNPEKLVKIPVPVNMSELDFYPTGYEDKLDDLKWKKAKASRDSLYLSFEEFDHYSNISVNMVPINKPVVSEVKMTGPKIQIFPQDDSRNEGDTDSSAAVSVAVAQPFPYISPSNVLAFWNKKFNNTNLATREFETRMHAIHATCNNEVLAKYTQNLRKPISAIDQEVVNMGYSIFQKFVEEGVGAVNPNNPHIAGLQKFYEDGIEQLKRRNSIYHELDQKKKDKWDKKTNDLRQKEQQRTGKRKAESLNEEYAYNLDNVYKQLGYSKGFTIKRGSKTKVGAPRYTGPAIKNIDAYVWEATANRSSATLVDPLTGKTAQLTYNTFTFDVANPSQYIKLYAYIFPHELKSYQRIDGVNGKFDYPLNDDILYDFAVVGITEKGYAYFQKQSLRSGELGTITLETITESDLEASIEQLNGKRISRPKPIGDELKWLFREKADYAEQQVRKKMAQFREEIVRVIFPCYTSYRAAPDNSEPFGI